ncbi:MAG: SDR family NAD(P)-dependent oxidoreductase [Cyclobacteriaceae bacterium]
MILKGKNVLITGGTGSFGQAYATHLLESQQPNRLIIFSRDEQKHFDMQRSFAAYRDVVEFIIGDIRDKEKIQEAIKGMDYVIHTAAMKHMPMAEDHPLEAIKTNLLGTQNVIDACIAQGVKKVVALSTDKAALPINSYGATKLLLERLFQSADGKKSNPNTRFSLVRYANVFGSKGSVVPVFQSLKATGKLPITDTEMSRFSIRMDEAIALVNFAMHNGIGGEIIVPIAPSYTVGDMAEAICPECTKEIVGHRQGEKMHETLITPFEVARTLKKDKYYIITPEGGSHSLEEYKNHYNGQLVSGLDEYSSGNNTLVLTPNQIREQLVNF